MSANFPFTIPQNMYIFSLQTRRNIQFPSSWFMCFSIIFPEEIFLMRHLINHRRKKGEALGTRTPSLSLSFLTCQESLPGLFWTPWQAQPSSPAYPEHPDSLGEHPEGQTLLSSYHCKLRAALIQAWRSLLNPCRNLSLHLRAVTPSGSVHSAGK